MIQSSNIPTFKFRDFDDKTHEFNIRSIKEIRDRAGDRLAIPKRFDFYKIVYITHGKGMHNVDMQELHLKPQSILPIDSNLIQCFSDSSELEGFVIHFSRNFFIKERENYKYLFNLNVFSQSRVIECSPHMGVLFHQIKSVYDNICFNEHYEQIINYLRIILLELELSNRDQMNRHAENSEQLCRKFKMALEKNITYQTKVAGICKHLNVDSKRLNIALQNTFGKGAKELLDERVLLEIKRLLTYSNLSVKEIAYKLKFNEASNFSTFFKRHSQVTPLQFRHKNKNSQYL